MSEDQREEILRVLEQQFGDRVKRVRSEVRSTAPRMCWPPSSR